MKFKEYFKLTIFFFFWFSFFNFIPKHMHTKFEVIFFLSTAHLLKSHSMIGCSIWRKNVYKWKRLLEYRARQYALDITRAQNARQRKRIERSRSEPIVFNKLEKASHYSDSCIIDTISQHYLSRISCNHSFWK